MPPKQWSEPPSMQIDPQTRLKASMETSKETIEIALYPEHALGLTPS